MDKRVDLLSYWMPTLKMLKEFKEIAKTEEPELEYLLQEMEKVLANMFIDTADVYGIKQFEDMMGLYPAEGESLETRRFNVLVKWNDKVPYTEKELYNRLESLCGGAEYFGINTDYANYLLEITTHLGVAGAFDAVCELLANMIPCNLVLSALNIIEAKKSSTVYYAVVTSTALRYVITNDIKGKYEKESILYYANGTTKAGTHIITHDIQSKVAKESPLNEGLVNSIARADIITHDVNVENALAGELKTAVGIGMATTKIITNDIQVEADVTGNSIVASPVSKATIITLK